MIKKYLFTLTLLFSLTVNNAVAEDSDDLIVNSSNQDLNYKDRTLYFSGAVSVQQGNISITADELFVETTPDGNTDKLIAKGKPAKFSQRSEDGDIISSEAIEITYLVEKQILILSGNAVFNQGGSQVTSDTIEFDLKAQRVKAEGDENKDGRVTTRLKTKKNDD